MKKYFVLLTPTILIAYLATFLYRYRNVRIAEKKALREARLEQVRKDHAEVVFHKLSDQLFKALASDQMTESYRLEAEFDKQNQQFNQLYTML